MPDLTQLAQYGLAGIALAAIIVIWLIVKEIFNFMKNHVNSNTEAMQELKDVIRELKEYLMFHNHNNKK